MAFYNSKLSEKQCEYINDIITKPEAETFVKSLVTAYAEVASDYGSSLLPALYALEDTIRKRTARQAVYNKFSTSLMMMLTSDSLNVKTMVMDNDTARIAAMIRVAATFFPTGQPTNAVQGEIHFFNKTIELFKLRPQNFEYDRNQLYLWANNCNILEWVKHFVITYIDPQVNPDIFEV